MMRKILSIALISILLMNFGGFGLINISAHSSMLEVGYDDCVELNGDGVDEAWYILNYYNKNTGQFVSCPHISHNQITIKYFFAESSEDGTYLWTTDVSESVANDIKLAYANSMKKWNNVYFYSFDNATGLITKNKVINVVEAENEAESDITIYPKNSGDIATTTLQSGVPLETIGTITHRHYSKIKMEVNINYFYYGSSQSSSNVSVIRERTGAHELGHVLGLRDVDTEAICGAGSSSNHHQEILMGYGIGILDRATDITYKDIAGVAITRGFHTDDDHMWLNAGVQSDGTYKLICSICNGVKYVSSLSGLTYYTYGACNGNHELSDGNMMAVASYGDKDYYKCKYCRYVAPFLDIEQQNYTVTPVAGGTHHQCTNNVTGLSYSFIEEHTWIGGECGECGFAHPHEYSYKYKNGTFHTKSCSCGVASTEVHFIRSSDIVNGRASCLGCKRMLDLNKDTANVLPASITQVTVNGSYILSNGIVVLVDADIEAYMDGTLIFYDRDDVPTTE